MVTVSTSHFRRVIEEHFDNFDLDVVCRKKRNAYVIYWAADHLPLAKLRPTGQDDEVEVYYWDESHWRPVNEFGLVLQLTECLQYISDDPEGLFFDADEQHGAVPWGGSPEFAAAVCLFHRNIFSCAVLGGAAGGMASGTGLGGIYGALAGMLLSIVPVLLRGSFREALARVVLVGIPAALVAGAGGVLGGGVNGFVSQGVGGQIGGLVIGGLASLLVFGGRWTAWGVGFMAGLTLAARLTEMAGWRESFMGLTLIALAASAVGSAYAWFARQYATVVKPILSPQVDGE